MKLSPNFWLHEFTRSQTAARHGIDNTPNDIQLEHLKILAKGMESVRTALDNMPIIITSGFRCQDLNDRLGSKRTSYHLLGLAADFVCNRYASVDRVFAVIHESDIQYQQLIREYDSWVHIAFPKPGEDPKRQSLIIDNEGTRIYNP